MARSIVQDKKASAVEQEKSARLFLERYGSHFPAGVQTLGGVFFSIADAESKSTTEASKLNRGSRGDILKLKCPLVFSAEHSELEEVLLLSHTSAEGRSGGSHRESGRYIAVWELLRDLGSEYEAAANMLEETWKIIKGKKKNKEKRERKGGKRENWHILERKLSIMMDPNYGDVGKLELNTYIDGTSTFDNLRHRDMGWPLWVTWTDRSHQKHKVTFTDTTQEVTMRFPAGGKSVNWVSQWRSRHNKIRCRDHLGRGEVLVRR
ncbi:hypothetical protein OS493_038167 [Desmophyllum pertusum]|uniref:Uncharacterized protein n=1 Tax=Desmophyllum pertusum TaxID=174260 RepID=A0A9W9Y790_9CNID|nr:hypothetical protein OS493_038167 [Desmophyllum pertusum]